MRAVLGITCVLSFFISQVQAQAWRQSLRMAEEAFENGEFGTAGSLYRSLLDDGYQSQALNYNAGITYLKLDSLGLAILNLERALLYQPNNTQIKNSIRKARSQMEDAVIPVEPFFLSEWVKNFASIFKPNIWAIISLFLLFSLCGGIYFLLTKKRLNDWFPERWSLIVLFACLLLSLLLGLKRFRDFKAKNQAIVIENNLELKIGPDDLSTSNLTIYSGEKVERLNSIGEWVQVELLNRDKGWVKTSSLVDLR